MSIMGMGYQELIIILVGALLIFGPDRLPEVASQMGKWVRDIRKMTSDLTSEFERTAGVGDIKKAVQQELSGVKSTVNAATKNVNTSVSGAVSSSKSSSSSAKTPATPTVTPSGSGAKTTAKAVSSTAAKEIKPAPRPVASKKDPLADVSFFEELTASKSAAETTPTIPASSSSNSVESTATLPVDALGRARQRRMAAGYNRHST
jgi:sec-independent protein translocase protein TatB